MRSWPVLVVALLAAFGGLWALSYALPPQAASVLSGLFVVGAGLAVNRFAAHRRRLSGADRPDSVEHECAVAAASATLPISLVVLAALAAVAAITGATGMVLAALAGLVVVVAAYWISYASARARC